MKIIKIGIIILIVLGTIFCSKELLSPKYEQYCGEITFKGDATQIHKYSQRTEFILVVRIQGVILKDLVVDPSVWSSHNIGDEYCWREEISPPIYIVIPGIIGIVAVAILFLFGLGYCIYWLIKDL